MAKNNLLESLPDIGHRNFSDKILRMHARDTPEEGVLHYGVRRGCAPVLGSFWPENSGIGINFYWKISVIGVYCHLEFSGIGVYCYFQNSGYWC